MTVIRDGINIPFLQIYVTKTIGEKVENCVILPEIPDKFSHVQVNGCSETTSLLPDSNQFYVDYQQGFIVFNSSENGKSVNISFKGKGTNFLDRASKFDLYDTDNDGIVDNANKIGNLTLSDLDARYNATMSNVRVLRTISEFGAKFDGSNSLQALKDAITYCNSNKCDLVIDGDLTITNALDKELYRIENFHVYGNGHKITANSLTYGHAVFSLGVNSGISDIEIEIANTNWTGGSNECLPIIIGRYESIDKEIYNVKVNNVKLTSCFAKATLICIIGNVHDVIVTNVSANGTYHDAILVHWGTDAAVSTAIASPNVTYHPHNIKIENLHGNGGNSSDDNVIFVSGCYNVNITNVFSKTCANGVRFFPGDYGESYVCTRDAGKTCKGNDVNNVSLEGFKVWGIGIDGYVNSGLQVNISAKISNCTLIGDNSTGIGIKLANAIHPIIENCKISKCLNGIINDHEIYNTLIKNCKISDNLNYGIYFVNAHYNTLVSNCLFSNNNTAAVSGDSDVYFRNAYYGTIEYCNFGGNTNGATYGIKVTDNNNNVYILKNKFLTYTSRADIVLTGQTNFLDNNVVINNNACNTIWTSYPIITSLNSRDRTRKMEWSDIPTSGKYMVGDKIYFSNVAPSGYIGAICTTSGYQCNTVWAGTTAKVVGDQIYNGNYVYECTVAGTTGGSTPSFPTTTNQTITDGTVTWKCVGAKAVLKNFGAIVA